MPQLGAMAGGMAAGPGAAAGGGSFASMVGNAAGMLNKVKEMGGDMAEAKVTDRFDAFRGYRSIGSRMMEGDFRGVARDYVRAQDPRTGKFDAARLYRNDQDEESVNGEIGFLRAVIAEKERRLGE